MSEHTVVSYFGDKFANTCIKRRICCRLANMHLMKLLSAFCAHQISDTLSHTRLSTVFSPHQQVTPLWSRFLTQPAPGLEIRCRELFSNIYWNVSTNINSDIRKDICWNIHTTLKVTLGSTLSGVKGSRWWAPPLSWSGQSLSPSPSPPSSSTSWYSSSPSSSPSSSSSS